MRENWKKTRATLGTILVSTGIACISNIMGGKIIEGVIGGIAGNLASSYIEKLEYQKIKNLVLRGPEPDELNHDLQKILQKAIVWALENIETLYLRENNAPEEKKKVQKLISFLKEEITVNFKYVELEEDIIIQTVDNQLSFEEMTYKLQLPMEELSKESTSIPFLEFFEKNFINHLKVCFGELLKQEKNQPAWIAYQRFLHTRSLEFLSSLMTQQKELSLEIKKLNETPTRLTVPPHEIQNVLKSSKPKKLQEIYTKVLFQYIDGIDAKLDVVLKEIEASRADLKGIKQISGQTNTIVRDFNRSLNRNWISKSKASILGTGLFFLMLGMVWIYSFLNREFDLKTSLKVPPDLAISPAYPAIAYPVLLSIKLPEEVLEKKIFDNNEIVLNDLSAKLKNNLFPITINSKYWRLSEDSIRLSPSNSFLYIQPNNSLSKVEGLIRGVNNILLADAQIQIGTDTVFRSNELGSFKGILPISMRKEVHSITVSADGYEPYSDLYYPSSGIIELRLTPLK